jgi:hypothetical protein
MQNHQLTMVVAVVVAVFVLYAVITLASRRPKKPRGKLEGGPYFQGAALTGTARVLSMKSTNRGSRSNPGIHELALAVEVSGLQPYEVTIKQKLPDWALLISMSKPAVLRTNLVTVEVDSAHPDRVRVVGDDKGRWYA